MKHIEKNKFLVGGLYLSMVFFLLNGINTALNFFGLSITIPVMVVMAFYMFYFFTKEVPYKSWFFSWILITYFVYLFISLFSLYMLQQTHHSIDIPYQLRSMLYNIIIIYVFYRFVTDRLYYNKFKDVIVVLFISATVGGLLTLYSGLFGLYSKEVTEFVYDPTLMIEERLSGIYANPNLAGFIANLGLTFSLTFLLSKGVWPKIIGIVGVVFSISTSVATFSKTSLLQCILITFIFLLVYFVKYKNIENRTRRGINTILIAIIILMIPLSIFLASAYDDLTPFQQERIDQITQLLTTGKANSEITTNRSDAVADGLNKIAEHPFIGNGFLSFARLKDASEKVGEEIGVHNTFLLVLGDGGIFPFILYLLFHVLCFVRFTKIKNVQIKCFAIMLLLSTIFFNTTNHEALQNPIQAVLIGIFCALASYSYYQDKKVLLQENT